MQKPNKDFDDAILSQLKEQEALMQPLTNIGKLRKWVLTLYSKIWQVLHYPIKNLNLFFMLLLLSTCIALTTFLVDRKYKSSKDYMISSERYSDFGQLEDLRRSHDYYYKASALQRRIKWMSMYYEWKWVSNGDPKYSQVDCVGAIFLNLQSWGSNFKLKTIPDLMRRVRNLEDNEVQVIRKQLKDVKSGDLIILKYSDANQHIGQVIDTPNGYVRYSSVNAGLMTEGEDYIKWGDPKIIAVIFICFDLWAGDLVAKLNR